MSALARQIQRRQLKLGKISRERYDRLRKDSIAKQERRMVVELALINVGRIVLGFPEIIPTLHPTKGWRFQRDGE